MSLTIRTTALLTLVLAGALPAQSLIALELAEESESICARLGIRTSDSAAIDTYWTNRESAKLIALARAHAAAAKRNQYQGPALEYLTLLEITKDRKAATTLANGVLRQLNKQPLELAKFVRYAVLSNPTPPDYRFARMALAAVVPDHPTNAAVRVTYIAALLGSGRVKEAVLTNKTIVEDLAGQLDGLSDLAHTICDSPHGQAMVKIATHALDEVAAKRGGTTATTLLRYRILHDLQDRKAEAEALGKKLLEGMAATNLNDWIWELLTDRATAGRYHALALQASQRMAKVATLDYHEYDTMALAWFCNGHVDRAIELQSKSLKRGGAREPAYLRRMARYEAERRTRPRSGKSSTEVKKK